MVHGMETSLYDDDGVGRDSIKTLKRTMTLDFNSQPSAKKPKPALLSSPDLKLLQLASPELERLIIQQNGMVTTTPTPTQFICPKEVTEQQEEYARGFMDALAELHKKQMSGEVPMDATGLTTMTSVPTTLTPITAAIKVENSGRGTPVSSAISGLPKTVFAGSSLPTTTSTVSRAALLGSALGSAVLLSQTPTLPSPLTSVPSTVIPTTCVSQLPSQSIQHPVISQTQGFQSQQPMSLPQTPLLHSGVSRLKEEPQTVPCSPPISPIDMDTQECIKLERKRERNRVAARKCRTRKLERISRLEDRVDDLKGQNQKLSLNAKDLRDQVVKLKRQIMEHVSSGCQVMLSQNVL